MVKFIKIFRRKNQEKIMNGIIKCTIIAAFSILLGGCSGTSGENNSNAPAANGSTSNQVNAATVSNNTPSMIPYPGTENTNGNPANSDIKVTNIDPKQIKTTNPAMPAPDNSEMLTVLNEKGVVETRTFKSNPLLAKVERTTVGRNVQLKIFLKNGKVVAVPSEKIGNFPTDSAQQILQAAGLVASNPVQNAETGAATGTKTEETKESKPNPSAQTPNAPPLKVPTKP
jgi:hypothetical protein